MRELLAHRSYRFLLASQTLAMFGEWTLLLVFGIWTKTLTGSDALAGLTIFALAAPGLLGPLGGVLVDRLPRRRMMIALNLSTAAVVAMLWLVQGADQLWLLFVVAALVGLSSVVFNGAMSGLVQAMMPPDLIGPANGLLTTVRQGLRLIGPLIGAGLFALAGGHAVATLDAVLLVVAALLLLGVRHPEVTPERTESHFRRELAAGLRHLWVTPTLRRAAVATIIFAVSIGMLEPTIYALVDRGLHRPPEFIGFLTTAQGVGAILGGLTVTRAIRRFRELPLAGVGLAITSLGAALVITSWLPIVLLGFALAGFGLPVMSVPLVTLMQRRTPPPMMGRVATGYEVVASVPMTASIALGALLVGVWPFQAILAMAAVGCAVAAVSLLLAREEAGAEVAVTEAA